MRQTAKLSAKVSSSFFLPFCETVCWRRTRRISWKRWRLIHHQILLHEIVVRRQRGCNSVKKLITKKTIYETLNGPCLSNSANHRNFNHYNCRYWINTEFHYLRFNGTRIHFIPIFLFIYLICLWLHRLGIQQLQLLHLAQFAKKKVTIPILQTAINIICACPTVINGSFITIIVVLGLFSILLLTIATFRTTFPVARTVYLAYANIFERKKTNYWK